MQGPSIFKHLRDILILPFTMTVIVPYLCFDSTHLLFPPQLLWKWVGTVIFISGLALFIWTVYLFRHIGKGTLAPWTPTQKLIIKGPYQYCRNPMISAVFFMQLGETIFLNSKGIAILAAVFLIVNTIYFILKEEPDLYKRFGNEYLEYKKHVPRWIPNLKPYNPSV